MNNHEMSGLVGRTIEAIYVGDDVLCIDTDRGALGWRTEADCCSETWFADIIGTDTLIGGKVMSVADGTPPPDYNVEDGRGRQECDDAYSVYIETDRGVGIVIYRNSSNGYYGGSLRVMPTGEVEQGGFGGLSRAVKLPEGLWPVLSDWSAPKQEITP